MYRCSNGESFDSVAMEIYGDEKYARDIMEMNPALCGMTVFAGGEELRLPTIDVPDRQGEAGKANTVAPWRRA